MCAKADDPLTINQNYRALRIGVFSADGSSLQGLGTPLLIRLLMSQR